MKSVQTFTIKVLIWFESFPFYSTDTNCLTNGGRNFNRARGRDFFLHLYPGQIYDLDDQCRMFLGPNSLYCGVRTKILIFFSPFSDTFSHDVALSLRHTTFSFNSELIYASRVRSLVMESTEACREEGLSVPFGHLRRIVRCRSRCRPNLGKPERRNTVPIPRVLQWQ